MLNLLGHRARRRVVGRPGRLLLAAVACCWLLTLPDVAAGQGRRGPSFDRSLGLVPESGLLNTPMGVAVSATDPTRIFVVDYGNARIQVFRPVGRPDMGYWGSRGEGRGQFWQPMDVATSPDGRYVYVVDAGRARVMQFEIEKLCIGGIDIGCSRDVLNEWGSYGSGPGAFRAPTGLAVDRKGRVYVADEASGNIQVFEADGTDARILVDQKLGGPGVLNHPRDIDVDSEGQIWVADTENHRIVVFDGEGKLVTQHLGGAERFHKPTGIAVAPDGSFIVRDFDPSYRSPRLWRYDASGRLSGSPITLEGYDKRSRYLLQGVDFLPDGNAVVANPYAGVMRLGESSETAVSLYLLPQGGDQLQPLAVRGERPGQFAYPMSVAVGKRYVVVGDTDNQRIQLLDAELGYAPARVVGAPELPLEEIAGVAISEGATALSTRIYVSDRALNQIFVLDPTGAVRDVWGDGRPRDFNKPGGVAVDAAGNVYIADTNNKRIVKRAASGEELASFGRDELSQPDGVAIGPGGLLYVTERGQPRLTAFRTEDGLAMARWDADPLDMQRPEPGELLKPVAIAADDRFVYVLENTGFLHVRTQVFAPEPGKPLSESVVAVFTDSEGAGPGLVYDPYGIAAHPDGRVLIADSGNNRVQLYRWSGDLAPSPVAPTDEPTAEPSRTPTTEPTDEPSATPTAEPTDAPTALPSATSTAVPTDAPTAPATVQASPTATADRPTRLNPLLTVYLPHVIRRW